MNRERTPIRRVCEMALPRARVSDVARPPHSNGASGSTRLSRRMASQFSFPAAVVGELWCPREIEEVRARTPLSSSLPRASTSRRGANGDGVKSDVDGPARPENWRDMVSTDYDYPAEMEELSRRDRRHAKKEWRRDDHTQRMAWLRDQRQAEPVSPVSVLVVVVLLGILILGIGGGLPKILGKDEAKQPVGLLTPADPLPLPTATGSSGPTTTEPSGPRRRPHRSRPAARRPRPSPTRTNWSLSGPGSSIRALPQLNRMTSSSAALRST